MTTTTSSTPTKKAGGARVRVQRFGTFLSGMVMPNIPAFIAWGLITALFIPDGWTPNEQIASMVAPILYFLLPLLIANTGGRMIYDQRGGVVATIATMGIITATMGDPVFSGSPMFLGAMIAGPLAAWLMKKVDSIWEGKIKAGFEMLVNNFSAGILGAILAIIAYFGLAPIIQAITTALGAAVNWLIDAGLLPLASILIEPAKVLFLNNAINHGVLTPLALQQSEETGKSILFLLEANPGPGLGLLLAFSIFGLGAAKATAPGAIIIQFFGGIHEIYFPYVLSKPMLLLAVIAGGASGVATNAIFGSGLVSVASPGSIFAILAVTERNSFVGVILSVLIAAAVSFVVAAIILRASRKRDLASGNAGDMGAAVAATQANKGKQSSVLGGLVTEGTTDTGSATGTGTTTLVKNIVFACDAGMGSSAMGASVLRNKIKKAGVTDVTVTNQSIANLKGDADLVITHQDLTDRAREMSPNSQHISVDNFMNSPKYDDVVELVKRNNSQGAAE
ncbi:PTS mannitol transporter subunit IICB [Mycetocola zhujimingii]|uniref:PTS system mannitol-specific EIICB component n=1 Tax=Mycetocola zhujimingii TaxID=2079792 RepID=A0A2U1TDT5_9MICO|nr:PTS mannitol transporter subunit IICB [Mycetocola zhujimingii]PWC07055.1 PTS mannitol transporter subunit IIB [Mycetocola zhujimingii]